MQVPFLISTPTSNRLSSGKVDVLLANTTTTIQSSIVGLSEAALDFSSTSAARSAYSNLTNLQTLIYAQRGTLNALNSRFGFALSFAQTMSTDYDSGYHRIVDVDVAEETSKLLRQQILQNTDISLLAHANQDASLLLSLLKS